MNDIVSEMLGSWAFWLVGSVLTSLLILYVTAWAPRRAAEHARRIPAAATMQQGDDGVDREVRVDVEKAMVAALSVHGDRIDGAHKQILEARVGTRAERLASLERAEELLAEAATAREASYEAAHGRAHVHWLRAELLDDPAAADAELRKAAAAFQTTTELRPRELDAYLGAGAVWIRLGRRWRDGSAEEAFDIAAGIYERAFEQARNNLSLMRAWATSLDGLRRAAAPSYTARRVAFDRALTEHRNGDHDLAGMLATMQASAEVPPAPGIEPFTADPRNG